MITVQSRKLNIYAFQVGKNTISKIIKLIHRTRARSGEERTVYRSNCSFKEVHNYVFDVHDEEFRVYLLLRPV